MYLCILSISMRIYIFAKADFSSVWISLGRAGVATKARVKPQIIHIILNLDHFVTQDFKIIFWRVAGGGGVNEKILHIHIDKKFPKCCFLSIHAVKNGNTFHICNFQSPIPSKNLKSISLLYETRLNGTVCTLQISWYRVIELKSLASTSQLLWLLAVCCRKVEQKRKTNYNIE